MHALLLVCTLLLAPAHAAELRLAAPRPWGPELLQVTMATPPESAWEVFDSGEQVVWRLKASKAAELPDASFQLEIHPLNEDPDRIFAILRASMPAQFGPSGQIVSEEIIQTPLGAARRLTFRGERAGAPVEQVSTWILRDGLWVDITLFGQAGNLEAWRPTMDAMIASMSRPAAKPVPAPKPDPAKPQAP